MQTKTFKGGVSVSEHKGFTALKKMRAIPAPPEVVIPLSQHIGSPNEPVVKSGDEVKVGQLIGSTKAFVSAPVHATVSGKVGSIRPFAHHIYGKSLAVSIENNGKNEYMVFAERNAPETLPEEELINIVKEAGIVGMGGAAFPTHVKLSIPEGKHVDTLIVNGAECEPYLTCDHRLMVEKTEGIIKGMCTVARILGAKNIFLAIEENKLSAILAMDKAVKKAQRPSIKIVVLKTKYPQGGEKQLLMAILKKEVPPSKLPLDVGCVVQNVGTCFAVYEAVYHGKPLIERCVTLTGNPLKEPGNFIVRFGTPLKHLIDSSGGLKEPVAKVIIGGPMMGLAQYSLDIPIIKGITGVVLLSKKDMESFEEMPCIRCAKCVDICPINLMPTEIMRMVKHSRWHYMKELHAVDCMECGACSYICPSRIPLTQYIKLAKIRELNKK
ncbi:MAG: electron transport complex subunit RsxC [Candidatus Omnitrophica bacterium]|nr:electron transport complex subunit RsxC [Candidatus Omnitrophota bacterium]